MAIMFLRKPHYISGLLFTLFIAVACSRTPNVESWEAAKLAYNLKKRADLHNNLVQLGAEAYAAKLATECSSDQTKCIEAFKVLRFAFVATEGEESFPAQLSCLAEKVFALDYLFGVQFNLSQQIINGGHQKAEADRLQERLAEVEKMQDFYIQACSKK